MTSLITDVVGEAVVAIGDAVEEIVGLPVLAVLGFFEGASVTGLLEGELDGVSVALTVFAAVGEAVVVVVDDDAVEELVGLSVFAIIVGLCEGASVTGLLEGELDGVSVALTVVTAVGNRVGESITAAGAAVFAVGDIVAVVGNMVVVVGESVVVVGAAVVVVGNEVATIGDALGEVVGLPVGGGSGVAMFW